MEEEEYLSKIVLELQPRSRRGYRRLFGIRENKYFKKEFFDLNHFQDTFLREYNKRVLRRGQHIQCNDLIIAVKQIKRSPAIFPGNTQVEFTLKGLPFRNQNKSSIDEQIIDNKGTLNQSFIDDRITKSRCGNIDIEIEDVYSCYCSECKQCLSNGDLFLKSGNLNRPIVCLSCYELLFTPKCVRCSKSITFDQSCLTSDGLGYIRFVEHNDFYWHCDCCVCVTCLESLIGKKYYQDEYYNQLFCLEHIPHQYL